MMWDVLEHQPQSAISVLYSARSADEFAYADELAQLAADGRIDLVRTVTRDAGQNWEGTRGRMNRELIGTVLKDATSRCVICGPVTLVADATEFLKSHGVPANRILTEAYAS
jgi:ferredoxin-NADP reductase